MNPIWRETEHMPESEALTPRVLLLGGGPLGLHALRSCLAQQLEVSAVVLRGSESNLKSEMSLEAEAAGIRSIKSALRPWHEVESVLAGQSVHYMLSAQYDRIIPPEILRLGSRAALNVHFGPLPRLRGCFPTKWAIINDETSGVTVHHIDEGIDTGPIVLQSIESVKDGETDIQLYGRLVQIATRLVDQVIEMIASDWVPPGVDQDESKASYHPKKLPGNGLIDWSQPVDEVIRFIRAHTFPPYPGAILEPARTDIQVRAPVHPKPAGLLVAPGEFRFVDGHLLVRCHDAAISIRQLLRDGESIAPESIHMEIGSKGRFGRMNATG